MTREEAAARYRTARKTARIHTPMDYPSDASFDAACRDALAKDGVGGCPESFVAVAEALSLRAYEDAVALGELQAEQESERDFEEYGTYEDQDRVV